jgi:penicillin-binding protein 1A
LRPHRFSLPPRREKNLSARIWNITLIVLGAWLAVFLGVVAGFHLWSPHVVRQFEMVLANTSNNTLVFDRNGDLLATVEGLEDRHTVPISRISVNLQKAVVAVEDRRFFGHRGTDPVRLAGAFWANLRSMAYYQGGSTITQQLVKLTLLSSERTLTRKFKEIFMAAALELGYPKLKLLEFYLNRVYLGHGLYGVEKASRAYFHKSAAELELNEAAFLAALIKKPEGYLEPALGEAAADAAQLPVELMEPLNRRRSFVLKVLGELGWVRESRVAEARAQPLIVYKPLPKDSQAPYFVQQVLKELRSTLGISQIAGRGYRIDTTLDLAQQHAAELLMGRLSEWGTEVSQGALVAMEPETGFVRAMVGGVDYAESQFNRAVQAKRQPGSAFKPIVYAAALEKGFTPNTMFVDEPVRYVWGKGGVTRLRGEALERENTLDALGGFDPALPDGEILDVYEPRNYNELYGSRFWGEKADGLREPRMTMARALERSSNVIAVQVLDRLGILPVVRLARRLDITLRPEMGLCIALGCSETTLMDLTAAYASFANGGLRAKPVLIRKVTNLYGDVLYEHIAPPPEQVISPWTAFQVNRMLEGVIRRGTGRRARLARPVGGKTGTNDGPRDAWFIGFTPELVAGVWVGNDDNRVMPNETGGRTPARLWAQFMGKALPDEEPREFPAPEGEYVTVRTCTVTGDVANPWCPNPVAYHYLETAAPDRVCTIHPHQEIAFRPGEEGSHGEDVSSQSPSAYARRLRNAFEESRNPLGE